MVRQFFFSLLFLFSLNSYSFDKVDIKDYNFVCIGCTALLGIAQNFEKWHKLYPIEKFLKDLCNLFPPKWKKYQTYCYDFVTIFGPIITEYLEDDISPDAICRDIGLCKGYEQCTLWPNRTLRHTQITKNMAKFSESLLDMLSTIEYGGRPVPESDFDPDGDYFSDIFDSRGTSWRGKDCAGHDRDVYPGRKKGSVGDYNCNGISGEYEEKLCGGSDRRGVLAIGDSACAHFRIPPMFLNQNVSIDMFKYAFPMVENEADWPHLGLMCGYMNDTTGLCPGVVNDKYSFYLAQRNRNLCNHRDYQTVCVNGAKSYDVLTFAKYIRRDPDLDHPAIVIIFLIGNDVCHAEHNFDRYTKPEVFNKNIMRGLQQLDKMLPYDSHVVMIGLADGGFLWKYLSQRIHPIGVKYEVLYDYMNCLKISPCWGYQSNNKTVRDYTVAWAKKLSAEYVKIVNTQKFEHFKTHFVNFTAIQKVVLKEWIEMGNDPYDMVEPVDAFHPSAASLPLFHKHVTEYLMKTDPSIFGEVNPNNEEIRRLFGDQGGY